MYGFQTILVYLFLFSIMYLLSNVAKYTKQWRYVTIAILIYSIIFGMRYGVGVDQLVYLESYTSASISTYNINYYNYEFGFRFLIMFLIGMDAHFAWFFGIIAFIQLYLVFLSVKPYQAIYPFLIFTFMAGCVWLSYANGLRQQLAFCIFVFAISFIEKKQWWWYYIMIVLAISMHKTAILLAAFYPLFLYKTEWFNNKTIQLGLLLGALIIGKIGIIQNYIDNLEVYATYIGYEHYFLDRYNELMYHAIERKGVGYYILLVTNITLIWLSTNYKHYFKSKYLYYIYNLYFVGVLLNYAFEGSQLFQRINYFFYGFSYIVGAFALLYAKRSNRKMFLILITMYILTFIATMYRMEDNTSLFKFFWQV